jgi:hypothetical protein
MSGRDNIHVNGGLDVLEIQNGVVLKDLNNFVIGVMLLAHDVVAIPGGLFIINVFVINGMKMC